MSTFAMNTMPTNNNKIVNNTMTANKITAIEIDSVIVHTIGQYGMGITPIHRYKGYGTIPIITTGSKRLNSILAFMIFDKLLTIEDAFDDEKVW
jgi:hypothetical protein